MRTDFECAQYGIEFLLQRPVAEAEVRVIFGSIDIAWSMITRRLAHLGFSCDASVTRCALTIDGKVFADKNLFRCLEQYLDEQKGSNVEFPRRSLDQSSLLASRAIL